MRWTPLRGKNGTMVDFFFSISYNNHEIEVDFEIEIGALYHERIII